MQLTEDTPARWESVIADLSSKAGTYQSEIAELTRERNSLVLDAELNIGGASKRLKELDDKIALRSREARQTTDAVEQARRRLVSAKEAVAIGIEEKRQATMRELAVTVQRHAEEVTASFRNAASAASAMKMTIQNMIQNAKPEEAVRLSRLLEYGPFMRAAEFAGLRTYLEFQPYTGLREHITPLEDSVSVFIGNWLPDEAVKEAASGD